MDSGYIRLSDINPTSQSTSSLPKTKPYPRLSLASLHSSPANHGHLVPPRKKSSGLFPWRLLVPIISLLWLVPIATLLALNYTHHIIGASAWCPLGRCSADPLGDDAVQRAQKLDQADHNTLGALQLVAKALDAWFMFIATSIVFDLSMIFATNGNGLPMGYFVTHLQFGDIRNLFNPLLWTSSIPNSNNYQAKQLERIRGFKFCIFVILLVSLTVLTNLMGPATAVLVLPTLQWVDMRPMVEQRFEETGAAKPPGLSGPADFPGCDAENFRAYNYSCTYSYYAPTLDGWAMSADITATQMILSLNTPNIGTSQERSLQFPLNASTSEDLMWVPNRQVLAALSNQFEEVSEVSQTLESHSKGIERFNHSLQTTLNRQGPAIGFRFGCAAGNLSNIEIATDKNAICYSGWSFDSDILISNDSVSTYHICFPWGKDWNILHRQSRFFLGAQTFFNVSEYDEVTVTVSNYFVEKAVYWNDTEDFGSDLLDCRRRDPSLKSCDWEKIFKTPMTEPFRNWSTNVGLTEYDFSLKPINDSRVWCLTSAWLGFPTYVVDTSPWSNPTRLVTMRDNIDPDPMSTPLVIDPNWLLAAWSVDQNGTVDGNRPSAIRITQAIIDPDGQDSAYWDIESYHKLVFILFHLYSTGQALSMINYYSTDPFNFTAGSKDASHPVFRSWATHHVWAYGFSGRTARLGAVVAYAGALCVLLRIPLSIFGGIHRYSVVELLVAALEHVPRGEFLTHRTAKAMGKIRFQLREDDEGRLILVPERSEQRTP